MELQLVHERLSLMNLRRDIDLASHRGSVRSKLRVFADLARLYRGMAWRLRDWKRSQKILSDAAQRIGKPVVANELPGVEFQRAETILMLRDLATEMRGFIERHNELISQFRKVRNRLRYRRLTMSYWLANRILRLYIQVHDRVVGQRRDVVLLLSELDPPKENYESVPDLMKSMAKAV
jgi:hypothetical protein